jgi:hypothetical protein
LLAAYGSGTPIALYISLCAAISFLAASRLKDYTNRDISNEYDV